jgi:hypothetical protein
MHVAVGVLTFLVPTYARHQRWAARLARVRAGRRSLSIATTVATPEGRARATQETLRVAGTLLPGLWLRTSRWVGTQAMAGSETLCCSMYLQGIQARLSLLAHVAVIIKELLLLALASRLEAVPRPRLRVVYDVLHVRLLQLL